ncbi:hypothetical protein Tco_0046896 [Tanacetum coccineum]
MAAYQRMIAGTDPTQREEALTVYGMETGQSSVPVPETVLTVCTARLRGQQSVKDRRYEASNAQLTRSEEAEHSKKRSSESPKQQLSFILRLSYNH